MEKTWVNVPDVLFFQEGPGVRNTQYTSDGVKLLNVANLIDGNIDLSKSDRYISEEEAYGKYKHFLCDEGDFIVASSGIKVEYIDKKMGFVENTMLPLCMNTSTIRFKSLDQEKLRIRYFMYYLKSNHFKRQLFKQITGSAQLNYGPSHLKKMMVPLTDIEKQDRIIAELDRTQNIINKYEKELMLLDKLIKARFVEMFGDPLVEGNRYPKVPLGSLTEVGSSKRIFEKEYVSEGIPFYRTKEIVELSKGNRITTELFITKTRYDEIRSTYGVPQKGDLLISAVGTIGVIWIVDGNNDFYFKDGNLLRVSASEKFIPEYLKYLLDILISAYKQEMSSGTAYAALTISALKKMMVYDVPLVEQEGFADFVHQVDKSKAAVQKALDETQLLFDSLMQEYFG